jgi:uncharacterized protein (DUF608 family)
MITRRTFLGLIGAGAAGVVVNPVWGAFELSPEELERWRASLFTPGSPRIYLSGRHTDAHLPLGGIGTGNIEIGADGQLVNWQLFNNLRNGQVPFHFAVKSGKTAKLLQTAGGPDWPRVNRIEMNGEYPVATLRYVDEELPVKVELEAFSPFAPLGAELSSLPLNVYKFRLHNPTNEPQTVSLAALMTNPVGYAAIGEIQECSHPNFGANVNEVFQAGQATGLFFHAQAGAEPTLNQPVTLYLPKDLLVLPPDPTVDDTNYAYISRADVAIAPLDRPEGLSVQVIDPRQFSADHLAPPARSVIWLEDVPVNLSDLLWPEIQRAVEAGATLVLSGDTMPLLNAYALVAGDKMSAASATAGDRPDILFEDFEHGYDQWTVTGNAFGAGPAHGTLPGQQSVSGFVGKGLVNSFVNGDDATGKMVSRDFIIERRFIRFLVGGGHYPTTQIRLVIGGQAVRATAGEDNEHLKPALWDVKEFTGQTAHLEIVDEQKGGWGHINVDQILFSDQFLPRAVVQVLDNLLPIRFAGLESLPRDQDGLLRVKFRNPVLCPGATHSGGETGLEEFVRSVGQGKVVLLAGQLLNPDLTDCTRERQKVYAVLCSYTGATYTKTTGQSAKAPGFGTMALTALTGEVTGWTSFESWEDAWKRFHQHGRFSALAPSAASSPTAPGRTTNGALATTVTVPAGGTRDVPFLFTWHYPNKYGRAGEEIGCDYTNGYLDAREVMQRLMARYDNEVLAATELFRKTFYDSTLPYWLLDGLTANAATIRYVGVVFRTARGDIYGWEGSNGSCSPTCTHVWGYEQSLAHLFPELERLMRVLDFSYQQNPDGGINNRTAIPTPRHPSGEHPFTDGHASCILKAYREALIATGGDQYFPLLWPKVKLAVEYLVARDAARQPDGQPGGILQDDQWNTYDEALLGVTTFISGYYLAALRAGEEWARRVGDTPTADRYHAIFESGQKKLIELCWNGEYFQQYLPDYAGRRGEVGPGCMSDQLIGQWWAHQLGLGYILPREMVKSALKSIFKYNWKSDLTGWKHSPRAFAGVHDKGLIICTWPKGGRPANVMLYSDEVWTGIEYEVAALMIYEGMVEEGLSIAKGARDRYDGLPRPPITRNPWCEIECGGHYARAMSSWSLLLALSGFEYDGPRYRLKFSPRYQPENFKCFFSTVDGWGTFAQTMEGTTQKVVLAARAAGVQVQTLQLAVLSKQPNPNVTVQYGSETVPATWSIRDGLCEIRFQPNVVVNPAQTLQIRLG